jgi:2-dehydro-3-deoxyphosphogluconate aldolase/(4S)-4-hydroxy-2-oxoglutarate aldolase
MKRESKPWDNFRIIPLVVLDDSKDVLPIMDALLAGGIFVVEIGLRTPAAMDAIKLASRREEMSVAAGTVTDATLIKPLIDSGASFGLSPAGQDEVLDEAAKQNWPFIPGVATPTEAQRMIDRGLNDLKVFPIDLLGGEKFLSAISAVLPAIRLLPTGGVSASNLASYLNIPQVFAASGSWIVPKTLIAESRFDEITKLATEAVKIANSNG